MLEHLSRRDMMATQNKTTMIRKLYLVDWQQFRETVLDFTDGEGKAHSRVCLIGRNGTGKTTTLGILNVALRRLADGNVGRDHVALEFDHGGDLFTLGSSAFGLVNACTTPG